MDSPALSHSFPETLHQRKSDEEVNRQKARWDLSPHLATAELQMLLQFQFSLWHLDRMIFFFLVSKNRKLVLIVAYEAPYGYSIILASHGAACAYGK